MFQWNHSEKDTLLPVNDARKGSTQEAHTSASCMLPRKVGKMVWVCVQFNFEENDGWIPTMY